LTSEAREIAANSLASRRTGTDPRTGRQACRRIAATNRQARGARREPNRGDARKDRRRPRAAPRTQLGFGLVIRSPIRPSMATSARGSSARANAQRSAGAMVCRSHNQPPCSATISTASRDFEAGNVSTY